MRGSDPTDAHETRTGMESCLSRSYNSPPMASRYDHAVSSKDSLPPPYPLTPQSLSPPLHSEDALGRTSQISSFQKWRPSFHLQPASGWMNDPCGPGYDPATGLYHVSFQWNAQGNDWGDISWGHATSSDFVTWDMDQHPSVSPDKPCDHLGIFTGCLHATKTSPLTLTYFYTSVNYLPIHHTLPYKHGCESLSLATSTDNGQTWVKHPSNPILPSPPSGIEVTGWRDPYVSKWDSLSHLMKKDKNSLYGIISGGIIDKTPTTFIYSIDLSDITKWTYIGPLVDLELNMRPSRWSGDLGRNWEVTNFMTLSDTRDPSVTRELLIMGSEGCIEGTGSDHVEECAPRRPPRCQLWMSGSLIATEEGSSEGIIPRMGYSFGGYLDHGCYYAANSFFDPVTKCHIVWGWVTEDDLCDTLRRQQNWSGMLSLPRRLQLATIPSVTRAWNSSIASITSVEATPDELGTFTIRTLATMPDARVVDRLRNRSGVRVLHLPSGPISPSPVDIPAQSIQSKTWELFCRIKVSNKCRKTGFRIGHNDGEFINAVMDHRDLVERVIF
jgi:beta-fructofuranosidase